jgi:hypothetical protein
MKMKLYKISQDENNNYDTYSSAVVCATDELTAGSMNPSNGEPITAGEWSREYSSWCSSVEKVKVKYLGDATEDIKQGVVCASYHAG